MVLKIKDKWLLQTANILRESIKPLDFAESATTNLEKTKQNELKNDKNSIKFEASINILQ